MDLEPLLATLSIELPGVERQIMARYIPQAVSALRDLGLATQWSHDMAGMADLQAVHRDSWPVMVPILAPARQDPETLADGAFWLACRAPEGAVVACVGCRTRLVRRDLAAGLEDLSFIYDQPEGAPDEIVTDAPSARTLRGFITYCGGLWIDPDWRRHGITEILTPLAYAVAYATGPMDYVISVVNPGIIQKIAYPRYRFNSYEMGVRWTNPAWGDALMALTWMNRIQVRETLSGLLLTNEDRRLRM